jgi:hypothetical protein
VILDGYDPRITPGVFSRKERRQGVPADREISMADRRRGESRELKKDQQVRREVLGEIGSEIAQDRTAAHYRNPNRDQARGDWDRSRRHTDQGSSRDSGIDGDDGLRAPEESDQ